MNPASSFASEFRVEGADGVRGLGSGIPLRLTRPRDHASVLLHEIGQELAWRLVSASFPHGLPDFSRPFVTRFVGVLRHGGQHYLVEPLPAAVPLLAVWSSVQRTAPGRSGFFLRALGRQLMQLLSCPETPGHVFADVCAANVVLTIRGVYGLLQAGISTQADWIALRPAPQSQRPEASPADLVQGIIRELAHPKPEAAIVAVS